MINAYLYLDNKKYRLLHLFFNFNQSLGVNNKPCSIPRGGQLEVTIPSTDKDLSMLDWTIHSSMQKSGRIEIMARDGASIGFKMEFANAYATSATYIYGSQSSEPMNYTITITAGILRINGNNDTIHKQTWDDGTAFEEQPAPIVRETQGLKVIDCYYTDLEGNEVAEPQIGDEVYVVLHTENGVGETTDINLSNQAKDFMYNGTFLEDDIIRGYIINSDKDKIRLQVVAQQEGQPETIES
ncbi:type VI secretion system tube protein TssD [Aquimarina agarilytica]|uniref:type VI secretion system tube protein TssD n=1 Tax=Aquimarina agarilytica TaxID=1087449 RepID=UPI00028A1D76|nr:type VI secretion system tube protein TssD [Aquimarina agarilytica]